MKKNEFLKNVKANLYNQIDTNKKQKKQDEEVLKLVSSIVDIIDTIKNLDYIEFSEALNSMREFNKELKSTYGDDISLSYYKTKINISIGKELVSFNYNNDTIFSISLKKENLNNLNENYESLLYVLFSNLKNISETKYDDFRKLTVNNIDLIKYTITKTLERSSKTIKEDINEIIQKIEIKHKPNIIDVITEMVSKFNIKNINDNNSVYLRSNSMLLEIEKKYKIIKINEFNSLKNEKYYLIKIKIEENNIEITYEDKDKVKVDEILDRERETIINLLKLALEEK